MRLLTICIFLFFITCTSVKNKAPNSSSKNSYLKEACFDTLNLKKRSHIFDERYKVKKQNRTLLKIITDAINDSISSELLKSEQKNKLINQLTKVTSIDTKKLKTLKPRKSCETIFYKESYTNTLDINSSFNFFVPNGFVETKEMDKEIKILQKYKDSSAIYFDKEPFCFDKGSYFKLNKNQYIFNNYTTYSNDGGDFWTIYKISNALDYNTNGWLKSAVQYRSFFKRYFSEEKRFFTNEENKEDYNNTIWHYTYFETKLNASESYIDKIVVYYITLENGETSEDLGIIIQKDVLVFKPKV